MELLFILLIGLTPCFLSRVILNKAKQRWETRLTQIRNRARPTDYPIPVRRAYGVGDLNCVYNARSPYLRCAVNPSGPCHNCRAYHPR